MKPFRSLRLSLRFIVPLVIALTLLAYAVVPLVDQLTLRWFIRDMDIRSQLIGNTLYDPMEAQTKGEALVASMERLGLTRSIFFGDDLTDEEVFQLKDTDLFGIHIGKDDRTAAPYYLNSQSELLGLLNSIVGILESQCNSRGV